MSGWYPLYPLLGCYSEIYHRPAVGILPPIGATRTISFGRRPNKAWKTKDALTLISRFCCILAAIVFFVLVRNHFETSPSMIMEDGQYRLSSYSAAMCGLWRFCFRTCQHFLVLEFYREPVCIFAGRFSFVFAATLVVAGRRDCGHCGRLPIADFVWPPCWRYAIYSRGKRRCGRGGWVKRQFWALFHRWALLGVHVLSACKVRRCPGLCPCAGCGLGRGDWQERDFVCDQSVECLAAFQALISDE